ncbi:uncharacterized protein BJ212DRAFT_1369117 [Suillus subaureus]|uniref:Uncharacterized protein n=1 Tax=Suillus subaureus TaxID=48587 RepID=A0A9P7JBM1_9AGAM|nr:uncharacterized protein BJ212DRAFT_1369117 [Suillus subaureus]KAG1812937.1 hypothetical protein BJ212DRAFT_1369117 [Suillus subaureus]
MSSRKSTKTINTLASQIELERTRTNAKNDVHRLDHKSRKIPKPKGQARRAPPRGYKVQEAMGLTGDNDRYNKFRAIARIFATRYLDLTKTIRAQDQTVVDYILELLQIQHPFLQQFEDVWPMRDMIGQFLWHRNTYYKHRPIIQTSGRGDDMCLGELAKFLSEPNNHPSISNATKGTRKSKSNSDTISKVPQHVNKRKQPAVEYPEEESQFALSKKRRIEIHLASGHRLLANQFPSTDNSEDEPPVSTSTRYTLTITLSSQSY